MVQVTLGAMPSIVPSPSGTCTDGDGTSLTLLAGVVRTDVRRWFSDWRANTEA